MDYWIEDSKWRNSGSQQGRDDWDFYRDKYGFSQGELVAWDSGSLKELPSYIHSNSYFRIKKSLNESEWSYIMGILNRINVSRIEHMELALPWKNYHVTLKSLTVVLGSGRFSRLQTLRMRFAPTCEAEDKFSRDFSERSLMREREHLAHALSRGCFKNLLTLSVPSLHADAILKSYAGEISQLRSLSIRVDRYDLPARLLREGLEVVVEGGCFKSLQHLDLGSRDDTFQWTDVLIHGIASGNLPNLRSLRLSGNVRANLADFVPFLLRSSNPLENLIMDDCRISSDQVHKMVHLILESPVTGLALKHLDLHNNDLDEGAVAGLAVLANSDKLPRLETLNLRGNGGSVGRLRDSLLNGHLRSLKLLIWGSPVGLAPVLGMVNFGETKLNTREFEKIESVTREEVKVEAQAIARLSDQWVHVRALGLYTEGKRYSRENIHLSDLHGNVQVEIGAHSPVQIWPTTGSGEDYPELLTGILNFRPAWETWFSSLPPASLPASCVSWLILSLLPSHLIKILGAFSAGHTCQWRSFSINIGKGLDNPSRSFLSQNLAAVFKSECFKGLQDLKLSGGVLDGNDGWKILIQAIRSSHLDCITSICLSQNALNQVDLTDLALLLFSPFESLVMHGCRITSEQVWALVDVIMNGPRTSLALKTLDLSDNLLGTRAVEALVSLANSNFLPLLKSLNLSMNKAMGSIDLSSLLDTIQGGHLPSLDIMNWRGNALTKDAVRALVIAYYEGLAVLFYIDWNQVQDVSLQTKAEEYRNRNRRLTALKVKHKEVLREEVPLMQAKVFLGGYPEVGKTTLRRAITQCVPEMHPFREARTRGIELSYLKGKNVSLTFWDLAGHEEYHVLHGTFFPDLGLARGRATTFVLVFKASFEGGVERDLLYWLRFAASSSQKYVRRHVVIVLNCFEGNKCTDGVKRFWVALLRRSQQMFTDFLDILPDPFVMDVRFPTVVEPLKNHLFEKTEILLRNVMVPKVCFELQERVKRWSQSEKSSCLPIMTWQVFEMNLSSDLIGQKSSPEDFRVAALYLHEMGGIICFDNQKLSESGSERRSVVVLDPDWFCSEVVGQLLLPKECLEGKGSLQVAKDGSIARYLFDVQDLLVDGTQNDDVISMLEQLGLCYRKNAEEIIVPALIQRDEYTIDWEGKGSHMVMGRRLAVQDHQRSAIPMTLFRRLQVELSKDLKFGGCGDSEYRAGKSFSSFKVGGLLVLIQFNVNHSDPSNDRIDILVKTSIQSNPTSLTQVKCICEILEKLEKLCIACCPGMTYDIKAIKPWSATERTPDMIEREIMSLREIKDRFMRDELYSGWWVDGNPIELTSFLSEHEREKVLKWRLEILCMTDELKVSLKAGEETDALDYGGIFEEGSEEGEETDALGYGGISKEGSEEGEETDALDYGGISEEGSEEGEEWHENSDLGEPLREIGEPDSVPTLSIAATSSPNSFHPVQLDDMVFEVYTPAHPEAPELEVVFFHGLKLQDHSDTYVSTWMTRDNSQLWLRTLLMPEFPAARILIVSYDSSPKKTYTEGLLDMYLTAENLLGSLTSDKVKLGQAGRPVVLVGHCLGGLVMKELCLKASTKLSLMKQGSLEMEKIKNLFDNLRGMFFYATAHSGSPMVDRLHKYMIQKEGLLLDRLQILNTQSARRNEEFDQLRLRQNWSTRGVGESRETFLEFLGESIFVVPDASARRGMDNFRTADADHFDVCKPDKSNMSPYGFLAGFLRQIRDAELRRAVS